MVNQLTIVLLILTGFQIGQAQIAYYDALELRQKYIIENSNGFVFKSDITSLEEIAHIILKFRHNSEDPISIHDLIESIRNSHPDNENYNPFLAPFMNITVPQNAVTINSNNSPRSILSSISGLDVTNIVHGISQFMIERAKQELTVAFFNRFQKFSEKYDEFKVLFPITTDNLSNLLTYNYPEMLPALRTGFLDDIKAVTYHLDDVLELPKYQAHLKNFPELKVTIRSIRLVNQLQTGESHAAVLLEKFAAFDEWDDAAGSGSFRNFGNTVQLAHILSQSLRLTDLVVFVSIDTVSIKDTLFITKKTENINYKTLKKEIIISRLKQFEFEAEGEEADFRRDSVKEKVDTIITSFTSDYDRDAWISFKDLQKLVTDSIALRLYVGLLYETVQANDIHFTIDGKMVKFHTLMGAQENNLFLFENKITEFVELANKVDKTLDTLKGKQSINSGLSNDELYDYIDVSLDVIEYGFSIGRLFSPNLKVNEYCKIARKANDLYRNIYKQEYTQAISNAMEILDEANSLVDKNKDDLTDSLRIEFSTEKLFPKTFASVSKTKLDSIVALRAKADSHTLHLLNRFIALQESHDDFSKLTSIISKSTKYGLFMANMVNADSPDEVASILDAAVLPVGSSSIKKHSNFNIAFQSYLGGFGNLDYDESDESAWAVPFGVIAPIGAAFSYGLGPVGSVSLFLPLLDIGAIADYQLKGNVVPTSSGMDSVEVTKDYKIRLGQIFSPGAYFVWGLPCNLPLSIGIGRQYGPGLGKIDEDVPVVNNPKWRSNIFLAVDIPLFNLVNTPKVQKRKTENN